MQWIRICLIPKRAVFVLLWLCSSKPSGAIISVAPSSSPSSVLSVRIRRIKSRIINRVRVVRSMWCQTITKVKIKPHIPRLWLLECVWVCTRFRYKKSFQLCTETLQTCTCCVCLCTCARLSMLIPQRNSVRCICVCVFSVTKHDYDCVLDSHSLRIDSVWLSVRGASSIFNRTYSKAKAFARDEIDSE